jgi:hypothetical protein
MGDEKEIDDVLDRIPVRVRRSVYEMALKINGKFDPKTFDALRFAERMSGRYRRRGDREKFSFWSAVAEYENEIESSSWRRKSLILPD